MKKMQFNRDVEHIKVLIANYDNSTTDDKIVILDELDYYLHQFDNANDFIFLEGLPKVVIPGETKHITCIKSVSKLEFELGPCVPL